jgi:sugar phosphate isomerase/epimerase
MVLYLINYCITLNSFHDTQSLEKILENLVRCNYDGIEIEGTPNQFSWKQYRDNIKSYNLPVIGVTGAWTKRDMENGHNPVLLTNDYNKLSYSITYIQNCIKMCNYLGGNLFNICLLSDYSESQDFNHTYISTREKKKSLQQITSILSDLSKFSQQYGVYLLLEPLNRYSTPYFVQAKDAIDLSSKINHDHLLLLLDTYHMNIEEKKFSEAINDSKKFLKHIHLSDNNRLMPGRGHIDFDLIIKSLKNINYKNKISFEIILPRKNYIPDLKYGLNYIKKISKKYDL